MQKRWIIKDVDFKKQKELSAALSVHPVIARVLINRGIDSVAAAQHFLNAELSDLGDPFLFKDMHKAVRRVNEAKLKGEKVLVFGDYDVDGVTSSALMHDLFKKIGIKIINHIPHRFHDGYGLNQDIVEDALKEKVTLLITVDCGISAMREVDVLNANGIDVIILDHHEPSEELPKAYAIINPKQKDCPYPFKDFASVGLVAKFAQALLGKIPEDDLDLVAMGTIADIVPLVGENRIFVKHGLPKAMTTKNVGLSALIETAKIKDKALKPYHVGFVLGPRINAAGRMDSAHAALDLFLCEDRAEALRLAKTLDQFNQQRQKMQKDVVDQAVEIIEQSVNFNKEKVIVLSKEGWHKGVLGIVASKITEKYYRPAIIISLNEAGIGTASARSIDGFHLHEALTSCASCLENFGGHEGAAGLTIKQKNIDPFKILINEFARELLEVEKLTPIVEIESEIDLKDATLKLAEIINNLEPFGEANPQPIFCSRNLLLKGYPQLLGKDTLKFWVTDGQVTVSAVGFGMAKYRDLVVLGQPIDLAYHVSIDDWNKAPTAQLMLKDIRLSEEG